MELTTREVVTSPQFRGVGGSSVPCSGAGSEAHDVEETQSWADKAAAILTDLPDTPGRGPAGGRCDCRSNPRRSRR